MSKERIHDALRTVHQMQGDIQHLGDLMTDADSEDEANEILLHIRKNIGEEVATDIWDYYIDWDRVKWKQKEEEVTGG